MKRILFTLSFLLFIIGLPAQTTSKKKAVIQFAGEKSNHTRTYLAKLKKGDPYMLDNYLQSGTTEPGMEEKEEKFIPKTYEPRRDRNDANYLSDDYKINEKKLKKGKNAYYKKYLEKKKMAFSAEKKFERSQNSHIVNKAKIQRPRSSETRLAKKFKIKGRRLHKGKKLKYPSGNVHMLFKYQIRTNNTVKTYVTDLKVNVEAGKKYYLKYYGNESKRQYYLEPASKN